MKSTMDTTTDAPCILAIDIGTSSVRAGLYDLSGRLREGSLTRLGWRVGGGAPGSAEVEPARLVRQTARAIDGALTGGGRVLAVGACCFWHSLVGLDEQLQPLTPIVTWADTRPAGEADRLRADFDPIELHQRTGCPVHASYWPAKLLWLRRTCESFGQVRHWLGPADWLYAELFGQSATSVSMASATGLWNRTSERWDAPLCESVGVSAEQLGEPRPLAEPLRGLRARWAKRWPGLAEVPWTLAVGDGAASNVGSGCIRPGVAALMVGTSGAVRVAQPPAGDRLPGGLWGYRIDAGRPITGGAVSNGGAVFDWLTRTLRLGRDFEAKLADRQPGAHGLGVLPLLAGERTPHWRADVTGVIAGFTGATGPLDIAQGALEAVAARLADLVERLDVAVGGLARVIGTGEALRRSPLWPAMLADALGRPLELSSVPEASLRGAALLAADALALARDDAWTRPQTDRTIEPRPARHDAWRALRQRNDELSRRHYG